MAWAMPWLGWPTERMVKLSFTTSSTAIMVAPGAATLPATLRKISSNCSTLGAMATWAAVGSLAMRFSSSSSRPVLPASPMQ